MYFYGDTKKTICVLPTVYYSTFHCLDVCRKYPIIPSRIISNADISAYGQRPRGKKNANRALRHACRVPHLRPLMAYWWVFNNPFRFSQIGIDLHMQIRCSMLDRYVQDLSMSQQILHTCILRYVGYRVNN